MDAYECIYRGVHTQPQTWRAWSLSSLPAAPRAKRDSDFFCINLPLFCVMETHIQVYDPTDA